MGVEAGSLKDDEKKRKKIDKNILKEKENKEKEKQVKNKEIRESLKAEEALSHMKDMINDENLELNLDQVALIEKVISSDDISNDVVEEILEKIDEIENTEDIDKYLPKESRITGEEYKRALTDDVFRTQILTKLDAALTILSTQITGDASAGLNLFSGYMAILDKKLISIQDNHIDIKYNLKDIDDKKFPKPTKGIWNLIIDFIKKLCL